MPLNDNVIYFILFFLFSLTNVVASWRADGQIYALRLMTGPHFSFYPKFSKEQLPAYFLLLSLLFHRDFEPQFFCFVFALT